MAQPSAPAKPAQSSNQTKTATTGGTSSQRKASQSQHATRSREHIPDPPAEKISERTKVELVNNSSSRIKDLSTAREWLEHKELIPANENITPAALSLALLFLARGSMGDTQALIDGMRSVALCLDVTGEGGMQAQIENSRQSVEELVKEAKTAVEGMVKEAKERLEEITGSLQKVVEGATAREGAMEEQNTLARANVQGPGGGTRSYAAAVAHGNRFGSTDEAQTTQQLNDYIIREAIQRRKIILDGVKDTQNAIEGLNPKQLVEKGNMAIRLIAEEIGWDDEDRPPPEDAKFISAQSLKNGGVLLEMDSEEAADWVREKNIRRKFEAKMGGTAIVKARQYQVVARFVSAGLKESLANTVEEIERDNHLEKGTIEGIRWMRDTKHWKDGQKAAHAVINVSNIQIANNLLRDGIIIEKQRHKTRKLEEDPRRCYKCQKLNPGHVAAQCPEKADICPNCAGDHVGSQCNVDEGKYACATCKARGWKHDHAAWFKACPSLRAEKERLRTKNPGMRYKFFLTDESWTQVILEDGENTDSFAEKWQKRQQESHQENTHYHDNGWGGRLRDVPIQNLVKRNPRNNKPPGQNNENANQGPQQSQQSQESRRSISRRPGRRRVTGESIRSRSGSRRPLTQEQVDNFMRSRSKSKGREQERGRTEVTQPGQV